jgi:hypothetical protein
MPTVAQIYENDQYDIYNLTEGDLDLADYIPISDNSASGDAFKIILNRLLAVSQPAQGRLTLESGVPFSINAQTAKTTLYFTPFNGAHVTVYDGTRWVLFKFTELSLNISAYTANKNYDVWVYSNSGTLTLDSTVWTNDTTRATSLASQNGILVKSGDATRRYLGTIRITGTTGQCEDSYQRRFVWNYYNRMRQGGGTWNTNATWTYSTATWRESNGGTGHSRFEHVIGVSGETTLRILCGSYVSGNTCNPGAALDTTTGPYVTQYYYGTSAIHGLGFKYSSFNLYVLSAGYHYCTQLDYGQATTVTWYDGASYPYRLAQFVLE